AGQGNDRRERALAPAVAVSETADPAQVVRLVLEGADPDCAGGTERRRGGRVAMPVPDRLGDPATVRLRLLGHVRGVPAHQGAASAARIVPVPDIVKDREAAGSDVAVARGVDDTAALVTLDRSEGAVVGR